jgi:hypothetical protein
MILAHDRRWEQVYILFSFKGAPMFLSFMLSRLNRTGLFRARFVWSPALDLKDHTVYSTLLSGTQY